MSTSKITLSAVALLIILFAFATPSMAQFGKIGYIDSDKIGQNYKAFMDAQSELEVMSREWDEKGIELKKELEEMITEYDNQKLIFTDETKRSREAAIQAQQQALDAYTKEVYGPNGAAEKKYNALMKPLYDKVNTAINQIATEGNYDLIFNSGALAFSKPEYDVTDKVLELLEEE